MSKLISSARLFSPFGQTAAWCGRKREPLRFGGSWVANCGARYYLGPYGPWMALMFLDHSWPIYPTIVPWGWTMARMMSGAAWSRPRSSPLRAGAFDRKRFRHHRGANENHQVSDLKTTMEEVRIECRIVWNRLNHLTWFSTYKIMFRVWQARSIWRAVQVVLFDVYSLDSFAACCAARKALPHAEFEGRNSQLDSLEKLL